MERTTCKNRIVDYLLLYAGFAVYSFGAVFAKYAAAQSAFVKMLVYLIGEIFVLGIYAVFWQQALKRFPLVVAISNKGVTVVFSLIWSALLFQEEITIANVLGSLVIFLGIWMVSTDG